MPAALIAFFLFAAFPTSATAGTYQVRECFASESYPGNWMLDGEFHNQSPNDPNYTYGHNDRNCSDDFAFIGVGDCGYCGWASYGDVAWWELNAPAATTLVGFSSDLFSEAHYGHEVAMYVWRTDGSWATLHHNASSGTWMEGHPRWTGSGKQVRWQIWCPQFGCSQSSASGMWVQNMHFTLSDSSTPTVSAPGGSLVSGGWKKTGSETVTAQATDTGSGPHSVALEVNGSQTAQQGYSCSITNSGYAGVLAPCDPGSPGETVDYSRTVNTGSSPFQTGINAVSVCAKDFANDGGTPNKGCRAGTAKVDGAPPSQTVSGSGWNPNNGVLTPGSREVNVSATDGVQSGSNLQRQSGVEEIQLRIWRTSEPRPVQPTAKRTQNNSSCGSSTDSCPLSANFTYDPGEYAGSSATQDINVEVTSVDEVGNAGSNRKTLTVTSGPAPDTTINSGPSGTIEESSATFTFSSSIAGSTFECRTDWPWFDAGAWKSCTSPKTYSEILDGTHTFEVRAKGPLGAKDQTPATRTFTVDADIDEPTVTINTGAPAADGSYPVTLTAQDPHGSNGGATGSGVEHLELLVDGETIQEWDQTCDPNVGGCSMTRTVTLSGSQSTTEHELAAFADDRSGNGGQAFAGKRFQPYAFFGLNDQFGTDIPTITRRLQEATNLARDVTIRFPIDWCVVARNPSEPERGLHPEEWTGWGIYDTLFEVVRSFNQHSPRVSVIAEMLNSPPWANQPRAEFGTNPDGTPIDYSDCHPSHPDPAPVEIAMPPVGNVVRSTEDPNDGGAQGTIAAEQAYQEFVREVLTRYRAAANGIIALEPWNEPNLPSFWGSQQQKERFPAEPGRYAGLVSRAAQAVRQAGFDPAARRDLTAASSAPTGLPVLTGSLSQAGWNPNEYLRQAITQINSNDFHGISIHLYANQDVRVARAIGGRPGNAPNDQQGTMVREYNQLTQTLDQLGEGNRARWITELGFPARPSTGNEPGRLREARQRSVLIRAGVKFGVARRVIAFLVHRLVDEPGTEPKQFGLLREDYSRRPAFCALANRVRGECPAPPP